jgi:hypothetical protein
MEMKSAKLEIELPDGSIWKFTISNITGDIMDLQDEYATISLSGVIARYDLDEIAVEEIPNIRMIRT